MPFISVIIPTYNRSHSITSSIESVLAQSYTDYELIVIDDGSTDDTYESLKPYFKNIIYIYQKNSGVSAARNTGVRNSTGKWVAFLDSDDEWHSSKLELQVNDIIKYNKSILSCTNVTFKGTSKSKDIDYFSKCLSISETDTYYLNEPGFKQLAWTSSVLCRRDRIIEAGLFDERLSIHEDTDLFYRMSLIGGFVVNPKPLVNVYRRDEQPTLNLSIAARNNPEKHFNSLLLIYRKLFTQKLETWQQIILKKMLSNTWFDFGFYQYTNKQKYLSIKSFSMAFKSNPSLKILMKILIILLGPLGVFIINSKRKMSRRFRRSEYYEND